MYLGNIFLVASAIVRTATADWTTGQWDTIIVGAGPAGIIVGKRMADAGLRTLLLEAGGPSYGITGGDLDDRRPDWLNGTNLTRVDVPGLYKSIFAKSDNLTCSLNSYGGCAIGGGSAINAGLFFEPPASDYDLYFPLGWKSKDVKNATARLYSSQVSTNLTSQNGVRHLQTGYIAARKWLVDGLGFKDVDINAKADDKTEVFGHPIFDYANGQRGGPTVTYLQSVLHKSNFQLHTGVQVIRVERNCSQATGVTTMINGTERFIPIASNGRVILSSGAIQSPSLLMFSGIGEPSVLSKLKAAGKLSPNIRPPNWINSTAIGAGLFDNPNTFIELEGPSIQSYTYSYDSPPPADKDLYLQHRSGPYSFASETSVFWDRITRPDGSIAAFQGTIDSSGYGEYTSNNTITLNIYGTSGMKSTGNVVLSDTFAPGPDSKVYYGNPIDSENIAAFIHKIFQGLPSSGLTPLNIPENATQAEIQKYITTYSQYAVGSVNHWSSSCRIGDCVDVNTTVVGMKNLHVVDASIVEPLTVNPQFGVMVAAERASELILGMLGNKVGQVQV
ncbi:Cellobiose dehydrogenase [Lachnellula suecica]|uniref:Cellobiose dehydrogenase n=1 Tax=Lachnellula suecica TaxID=602035 RepID=A0A8T9CC61_9HELO|nr:Cellobiose dehydrogenase [Lachnellula suecica]